MILVNNFLLKHIYINSMHDTFLESKKVIVLLLRENIESVEDPRFAKREINAVDVFFKTFF